MTQNDLIDFGFKFKGLTTDGKELTCYYSYRDVTVFCYCNKAWEWYYLGLKSNKIKEMLFISEPT